MREPRFIPSAAASAIVATLLLGCAPHVPSTSAPTAPPPVSASSAPVAAAQTSLLLAERHEVGAAEARHAMEAVAAFDQAYEEGRTAYQAGSVDDAFADFDKAFNGLLEAKVDLDSSPDLRGHVDAVLASMNQMTVADAQSDETPNADGTRIADLPQDIENLSPAAPHPAGAAPATAYTVPMTEHPSVDAMIAFYTGPIRDKFLGGLQRFALYRPTIDKILAQEGVPPDLAYLALVESNCSVQATSRARARGLWQFIADTGRKYGLKQDFWVDERSDFEKETRSAARYLKDLHDMFGDWQLALAAYNAGEGTVYHAMHVTGAKDFWALRQTRYLRVETKNYVPAFLAVMRMGHDPAAYGLPAMAGAPLSWDTVTVTGCTDVNTLARCAGATCDDMVQLNPELRRGFTPASDTYALRVPTGTADHFNTAYAALPAADRLTFDRHVVRPGETVASIAKAHGSTLTAVRAANGLDQGGRLRPGRTLLVPVGASADAPQAQRLASLSASMRADEAAVRSTARPALHRTHTVRPGETLTSIASRYGVSAARVAQWNGLRGSRVRSGEHLVIHSGAAAPTPSSSVSAAGRRTRSKGAAASNGSAAEGHSVNKLSQREPVHAGERLKAQKPN